MSEPRPFTFKHYLPYVLLLIVLGFGIWLILSTGSRLYSSHVIPESTQSTASSTSPNPQRESLADIFRDNLRSSLSILLLQLVVIIVATRVLGNLFKSMGQPAVLGEIIAGVALGPSLLGWLSPQTMAFLFPAPSLETLKLLSQIGVALFMFVVGLELNVTHLRRRAQTAIMVSHASIVVPFFLGVALSLWLYESLAPAHTRFPAFALFIGIAMSITAFPVLARILEDRRMSQTELGSIALTCAAVDDVTAWCLLALVIAIAESASLSASFLTIGLALAFILIMLLIVRPQLARFFTKLVERPKKYEQSRAFTAGVLVFVLACALVTEVIGIHALFGAFLAGVVMPSIDSITVPLQERFETFSSAALLPLFFAFTGLRMQINLLNDWQSWAIWSAIVAVAIAGKLGASMLMARWTGMNWRNSFALGALMNTRGLVELVVLNIGYDLGILSARLFAMLVLMAFVTTLMTGPLLSLAKRSEPVHS